MSKKTLVFNQVLRKLPLQMEPSLLPPSVLLVTINARYQHTAFGLRYLQENLGEFKEYTKILEFTVNQNTKDITEVIYKLKPRIVGFGVYIWNVHLTYEVVSMLKRLDQNLVIVLGGPEVSHETEKQAICHLADFTIKGEAEFLFYEFCKAYLDSSKLPFTKWIAGELPNIERIALPYSLYTDEDIKNRVIYVEASRGCPYKCEYCLSSLDKVVRSFNIEKFLAELDVLIQRGARQFKFVDRTFNLNIQISIQILQFFLDRSSLGLFIHFELVPDRLPFQIREVIKKFPRGAIQFEVGIQTWNKDVAKLVSRKQDYLKVEDNLRFLKAETNVYVHADLIVGLPGETLESFAFGFDCFVSLDPDEVQVGILKRLKGTPISRHDVDWEMVYEEHPPFQVIHTKTMTFEVIQELRRFSRFWDLYVNSGNFKETIILFIAIAKSSESKSVFYEFLKFSKFLSNQHPETNGISLVKLTELAWTYFRKELKISSDKVRMSLIKDYVEEGKRSLPPFLKVENCSLNIGTAGNFKSKMRRTLPKRQTKHLSVTAHSATKTS